MQVSGASPTPPPSTDPHPPRRDGGARARPADPDTPPQATTPSARSRAREALRRQLIRRPRVTLGAAAAVGFFLAGGVTSPAMWSLARLGARLAFAAALRELDAVVAPPEPEPARPA